MKKVFYVLVLVFASISCVEKTGYYELNQREIIDNLVNSNWTRSYYAKLDNGEEFDVEEIWAFKEDGSGYCKNRTIYKDKGTDEKITYFHWAFTTPNFDIIYLDYGLFWEIDKLTSDKLCIFETYKDPLVVLGQTYRDYQEFESIPVKN